MLPQEHKKFTYEEFLEIAKKSEERLEFIDGEIYYQVTPTLKHQRIVGRIYSKLLQYFEGKSSEPFIAPYDIILKKEDEQTKRVQPDIFVLCGDKNMDENEYEGIPNLIIEVLSPSNSSHDLIAKMNLYMKFGVPEYWIVIPQSKTIQVYEFKNDFYEQVKIYTEKDLLISKIFDDLSIELKNIFSE